MGYDTLHQDSSDLRRKRVALYAAKSVDDRRDKRREEREFDSIAYQRDACQYAAAARGLSAAPCAASSASNSARDGAL